MDKNYKSDMFTIYPISSLSKTNDQSKKQNLKRIATASVGLPNDNSNSPRRTFSQRYLILLTNILYYTCILPFRLSLRETEPKSSSRFSSAKIKLERNSIQTVMCLLAQLTQFISICFMTYAILYKYSLSGSDDRPLSFLGGAILTMEPSISAYHIYTAWFHPRRFEWLLTQSSSITIRGRFRNYSFWEHLQNWATVFFPTITIPIMMYTQYDFYFQLVKEYSLSKKLDLLEGRGQVEPYLECAIFIILCFWNIVICSMADLAFLGVALCFRDRTREFIEEIGNGQIQSDREDEVEDKDVDGFGVNKDNILKSGDNCDSDDLSLSAVVEYLELEKFTNVANDMFGGWTLLAILYSILFYSMKLVELLSGKLNTLSIIGTLSTSMWILSSAKISNQICKGMRNWIDKSHSKLSPQKTTILMTKVTQFGVALRGGNYFVINYPLIRTIVSLVITWAFIDQSNKHAVVL